MKRNLTGKEYARTKYVEYTVRESAIIMDFLMKAMYGVSKNRVKDLLKGRAVSVDRKLVTHYATPVEPGQIVRVLRRKRNTELVNQYVKIIYEDKDLVVIDKNVNILSMATSPRSYSVKNVLDEYFRKRHFKCTAHVVHRLDRDTSGLMVYAKNIETQKILEHNWHQIAYDRRYVAVVCGKMEQEGGTIRTWLTENKSFVTISSDTDNGGKEAITHFHTLETNEHYSLVEIRLETGRKNQIRVHMQGLNHPIAGDRKYGNGRDPLGRLALHAFRLYFYHPRTGEPMYFDTPFPVKFMNLFKNSNNINHNEN